MLKSTLVVASLLASISVSAQAMSGNVLYDQMKRGSRAQAMAYVEAVADVFYGNKFCPPEGTTVGQIYDLVEKNLRDYPQYRQLEAWSLILVSLEKYYPCSTK